MAATNIRKLAQGNRNVWPVDPRVLKMKWNARDDTPELLEHIAGISLSIRTKGFDPNQPITVYDDGEFWTVSDGHCRLRATLLAIKDGCQIKTIPVLTEPKGTDEADRIAAMLTRNSGKHLTQLEQGRVYKLLKGFGWTDKEIGDTTGKSTAYVKSIWDLMESHPDTKAQVIAGDVSASVVATTVRDHGPAKAKKVLDKAITLAHANGHTKATARTVRAVIDGEGSVQSRTPKQVMDFFQTTVSEQDGPVGVQRLAAEILSFRDGKITPEVCMRKLAELVGEAVLV